MQTFNKSAKQFPAQLYGYVKLLWEADENTAKVVKLLYARNWDYAMVQFAKYANKKGYNRFVRDLSIYGGYFANENGDCLFVDWRD